MVSGVAGPAVFAAVAWTLLSAEQDKIDRLYFGSQEQEDQIGLLEGVRSRFGRTYAGEPDRIAAELAADAAVQAADYVLFTVPNQLGVEYNARILSTIVSDIAPAFGWNKSPSNPIAAAAE